MHLGGLLSTQEARVALGDASFVLSNLPRASITPWLHVARLPFLNLPSCESAPEIQFFSKPNQAFRSRAVLFCRSPGSLKTRASWALCFY